MEEKEQILRQEVEALQRLVTSQFPDTQFRLQPSKKPDLWHLGIFTPTGNLPMPPQVMSRLDDLWRRLRISVVTVVYPLSMIDEPLEDEELSPDAPEGEEHA